MPNLDNVMSISVYLWNNNYNNLWINVGHVSMWEWQWNFNTIDNTSYNV